MTVMQLLIFSPFLLLGLLTVSVTVTKGKRPRQKLDFEISRLVRARTSEPARTLRWHSFAGGQR